MLLKHGRGGAIPVYVPSESISTGMATTFTQGKQIKGRQILIVGIFFYICATDVKKIAHKCCTFLLPARPLSARGEDKTHTLETLAELQGMPKDDQAKESGQQLQQGLSLEISCRVYSQSLSLPLEQCV